MECDDTNVPKGAVEKHEVGKTVEQRMSAAVSSVDTYCPVMLHETERDHLSTRGGKSQRGAQGEPRVIGNKFLSKPCTHCIRETLQRHGKNNKSGRENTSRRRLVAVVNRHAERRKQTAVGKQAGGESPTIYCNLASTCTTTLTADILMRFTCFQPQNIRDKCNDCPPRLQRAEGT